jgi:ADP-heptose:LPS heptosyltransferase
MNAAPETRAPVWPRSLPDYKWPAALTQGVLGRLRTWIGASLFHVAHAAGRMVRLLRPHPAAALLVRTDGIGDALLFEPALHSLARHLSPRQLHLWGPPHICQLLRACPSVHSHRELPGGFKVGNLTYFSSLYWRAVMGYRLGRWKFDVVVYPSNSPEPFANWVLSSARARERWYNPGDASNQFDWQRSATAARATRLLPHLSAGHELVRNARIAAEWDDQPLRTPQVHADAEAIRSAEAQLAEWERLAGQAGAQLIAGVVPAASMAIKQYPLEKWAIVLRQLWQRHRALPVLIGGPGDGATLAQLSALLTEVPHGCLRRPLDLPATGALVGRLGAVLTVDTGTAHLAVAQGVPTVVLMTNSIPGRFFPWPAAPHHLALSRPTDCGGCFSRCTQARAFCVTDIEPAEVVRAYARVAGATAWPLPVLAPPANLAKAG